MQRGRFDLEALRNAAQAVGVLDQFEELWEAARREIGE